MKKLKTSSKEIRSTKIDKTKAKLLLGNTTAKSMLKVRWEYNPSRDAEKRLLQAFEILLLSDKNRERSRRESVPDKKMSGVKEGMRLQGTTIVENKRNI